MEVPNANPKTAAGKKKARERNFITAGTVKIRWYRAKDGRTFVDPRKYGRKMFARADHAQALREGGQIALEILTGGTEALALNAAQRAEFAKSSAIVAKRGTDIVHALTEWAYVSELAQAVQGKGLADIVAAGVAALTKKKHTVAGVAAELLAVTAKQKCDARHSNQQKAILGLFGQAFPGFLEDITPGQIDAWLSARKKRDGGALSAKRRNHWRSVVVQLFKHARDRGYLPDTKTAAQKVERDKSRRRLICGVFPPAEYRDMKSRGLKVAGIFEPAELEFILTHVEERDIPWIALNGLAGARVEEIGRSRLARKDKDWIRWEDFDWNCVKDPKAWHAAELVIRSEVSKTGQLRRIPISRNLAAWLSKWKSAKGLVVPGYTIDSARSRVKRRLARLAKMSLEFSGRITDWPDNGLRHSYGSYRMALTQNLPQLAYEMGNSVSMIQNHYHNPRPREEGDAWFNIYPASGDKLIQLDFTKMRAGGRP